MPYKKFWASIFETSGDLVFFIPYFEMFNFLENIGLGCCSILLLKNDSIFKQFAMCTM